VTEEEVETIYNINLKGVFMFIQEFYPLLKLSKSDPNILVTSSSTGFTGLPFNATYAMFKAALNNMVLSM